jgi:hypothetical protein
MTIKRGSMSVLVAVAIAWAAAARADYVCSTHINPVTLTGDGDAGSVYATFYSGPNCTGTFTYGLKYCSTNATDSVCAIPASCSGNKLLYSGGQLNQLASMLQQALLSGERVVLLNCSAVAGGFVYFFAN